MNNLVVLTHNRGFCCFDKTIQANSYTHWVRLPCSSACAAVTFILLNEVELVPSAWVQDILETISFCPGSIRV